MEHTYNNPIVNAFVRLLKRDTKSTLSLYENSYVEAGELLVGEAFSELCCHLCSLVCVLLCKWILFCSTLNFNEGLKPPV